LSAVSLDSDKIVISLGRTVRERKPPSHLSHGDLLDVIIIGAGPAGITAAIYAVRKRLKTLVLTKDIGGQTAISSTIENYTGFQFITGPELTARFEEHLNTFDLDLHVGEDCRSVESSGKFITVRTNRSSYAAKTCIICTGATPKQLGVPGEKELWGRGLSTCSICDAPLFADKEVAVVGGGNSALDSALQLSKFSKKVYLINKNPAFKGDPVLMEKVLVTPNVELLYNAKTLAILGKGLVEGIKFSQGGKERVIPVEGVFMEIGYKPNSELASIVAKNEFGEIKVNSRNETSVAGIYAAGDVTDIPTKQIIVAAGEGAKAAVWAADYISRNK
jgi:alkyl hydroperoxide reductase subunit F